MLRHLGTVPLESERRLLRGLTTEDAPAVFANWTSDGAVARYMPWSPHQNLQETELWLRQCEEKRKSPQFYDWGIVLKATGAPIGTIGVNFEADGGEPGEVGYAIGRAFWRQGYTSEALVCMVDFLAREVGVRRLIGKQCLENTASGTVMERAGFCHTGTGSYESFDGARVFPSKVYTWTREDE